MGILISRTYTTTTPESAEQGDFADSGFVSERQEVTFRELVDILRDEGFCHTSSYPPSGDTSEWAETWEVSDWTTGEDRQEAIHYHRDNPPRNARYWRLAFIAAGLIPRHVVLAERMGLDPYATPKGIIEDMAMERGLLPMV